MFVCEISKFHLIVRKMRVVALVDMDCFYCQVEEKLNPELQGKPVAVVQYNLWREGGIIAANYLAKEKGVTKGMWKHEAKDLCPEIQFARVAELRGRADLTKYREAGNQVVDVMNAFPILLERASIDEAYLDLTESVKSELARGISNIPLEKLKTTHIVGHTTVDFIASISNEQDTDGFCEEDLKLAVGGIIVERIRSSVFEKTGYKCSAGIAQNKILAKLVCGLHKPNKQTILPGNAISQFLLELPLKKIKRLGGKFGRKVSEELNINKVGELLNFSQEELSKKFDPKIGLWLYNIARGINNEPVQPKLLAKSISCCKRFPGKNALFQQKDVEYWINELAVEVSQRLGIDREQHNRRAKMATISYVQCVNSKDINTSKTFALKSYESSIIARDALEVLKKSCQKVDGLYYLKYLGLSVGSFENLKNIKDIKSFFQKRNQNFEEDNDSNLLKDGKVEVKSENRKKQSECPNMLNASDDTKEDANVKKESYYSNTTRQEGINTTPISMTSSSNALMKFDSSDPDKIFQRKDVETKKIENKDHYLDSEKKTSEEDNSSSQSESDEEIDSNIEHSFFIRYFNQIANEMNNAGSNIIPPNSCISENLDYDSEIENPICSECGMEINFVDYSSHMDYHFALNLQREGVPSDEIDLGSSSDQSFKRRKVNGNGKNMSVNINGENHTEAKELCQICNKYINISEMLSHSDYHTAQNLQKIWNAEHAPDDCKNKEDKKNGGILKYLDRKIS